MFSLKNLVSTTTAPSTPWLFTLAPPSAVLGKDGKKARDEWINNPSTEWDVYSGVEGINPSMRISKAKGDLEGNPPYKLHAFIADYDAPVSDEELISGIARLGGKTPAYFERTMSGNSRFVWLLEAPIAVPNREFLVELLRLARRSLKIDLLSVSLDVPAWEEPNRYYTNSGVWAEVSDYRIPSDLLQGWLFEVAKKHSWKREESAVEIPLPIVWAELKKLYPLNGWPQEFEAESQGPTFWVPESTSPKSAIVKTTGLYTFSANAPKPFWSWQDLLGASFCEEYKTKSLGKAVAGVYYDSMKYWMKVGSGVWRSFTKEDMASHLQIMRSMSADRIKGAPSEIDEAMEYIRHWQYIEGAAPCAFQSYTIYTGAGPRILNTHTRRVLSPADSLPVWGTSGNFPWLSAYFDYLFEPFEQKDFFMAWLRRLYKGAYDLQMERGQNVFLIGSAGTGKTLLSQNILNKLLSGAVDAQAYLLGDSNFNSQLFESALWLVDDNSSTVSAQKHAVFSSTIKKLTSNQIFEYNKKFSVAATVEWLGRVFVTANDDEESLRIIPDLEMSSLGKTMLFRTTKTPYVFPSSREIENILNRELPHFARWLLEWEPPVHTQGTQRYGVACYHEVSLLKKAEHSSRSNAFSEILEDWAVEYFRDHPTEQNWSGTAFKLLKEFSKEDDRRAVVKNLTVDTVSRQLSALKGKGHKIDSSEKGGARIWIIQRIETKK